MRVAYIGNFDPPHSTENHYARSFEALGHRVWRLQENRPDEWAGVISGGGLPELLLYTRTWGLDGFGQEQFDAARAAGVPSAAVHLDLWRGLARAHEVDHQAMFTCDVVFQPDGNALEWYAERGVNARWLRPGVVADEAFDAPPREEWLNRWDVAFVGSAPTQRGGNYHEEWPHRRELVAWLRDTYGDRFVHAGNGGDINNNDPHPNLRGIPLNAFYASVPVIVGDSCLVERTGRYWSDRVYETWGRGGFLIHPRVDALEAELGEYPGWDVGDWTQLRQVIDRWLDDGAARETTRARIAAHVREWCTYTNRANELLTELGL